MRSTMPALPKVHEDIYACVMCGYCNPVCPPYQQLGFESVSPRGKVFYLKQYDQRSPLDRVLLKRKFTIDERFAHAVYQCSACGHCETTCHVDIKFNDLWDDLKAWLVDQGLAPLPQHRYLKENVAKAYNIYAEPQEKRLAWLPPEVKPAANADVVYWAGCVASYRKQEIARASVKLLQAGGVRFTVLGGEEWCTGSPLVRVGFRDFVEKELAPHNVRAVEATGATALVTACAECYRAFRRDYVRFQGNPPFSIYTVVQFVEGLVKEKKLKFTKPYGRKVTYHDPCHLGRHCGVYDEPRSLLKLIPGMQLVEPVHTREEALCCGQAGGYKDAFPQVADSITLKRLTELRDTGAEVLATACPFTVQTFEDAARRLGVKMEVRDVVEIAAQSL